MGIIEIVAAITGSSVLTGLITAWFGRRKNKVEAETMLVQKVMDWASGLTARINELEKRLYERDSQISELKAEIAMLKAEIIKLQHPDMEVQ